MTGEKTSTTPRYVELDALRGLAALLVVMFHFTMKRDQSHLGFNVGITGVELFFIISGFVIFMSVNSISSTKEFIINRFTRLYPTYWACVSFTYILYIIVSKISNIPNTKAFTDYLVNLTMFQYYFKIPDIDGPYWTMIIEMLFYIFIAIAFSIKQLKHIIPFGLIVLFIISIQSLIAATKLWPGYKAFQGAVPLMYYFPLFFSGIVFYKLMTETKNRFLYYALLLFAFTLQILNLAGDGEFITHKEHIIMTIIYFGLFVLFVNKKLGFIVSAPSLFLGKISFALYLIHQYIGYQVVLPILIDTYHFNFWLSAFICLTVVITLAALITYYIEIPLGKRMNNSLRDVFKLQKRTSHESPIENGKIRIQWPMRKIIFIVFIITVTLLVLFIFYKPDHTSLTHDASFSLKAVNNKYVCADGARNNIVIADRDIAASWEKFSLLHLDRNKVSIYSYADKFLSAELGNQNEITATRDKIAEWETFTLVKLDSNHVAFKAANGKYLSLDEKSLQLVAKSNSIGSLEKFEMIIKQ